MGYLTRAAARRACALSRGLGRLRTFTLLSTGAHFRPCRTVLSPQLYARSIAWSPHTHPRSPEYRGLSDEQEDAAKAAILEKVMKGRQPTDLMLRCEPISFHCRIFPR